MAANNAGLYNAALASALTNGGWITDAVQADYAPAVARAVAFATQVDSKIPLDGEMNQAKIDLLQSLCQGTMGSRTPTSEIAADYDAIATALAAIYKQAATALAA